MFMDRFKLKWRIFAFLLGFCILLITILWFFQTTLLTDMYKWIRKREIEKAIVLVEKNIDSYKLQSIINDLAINKDIIIMRSMEFYNPVHPKKKQDKRQMETIIQEKMFTLEDGKNISLIFQARITPVTATVSTLHVQLYIITGIMLLFAVGLSILISRHISKPIEKINKSAKVLGTGNYNTYFEGHGFLEIKELSDTLNTASTELLKVENLRRELMANISHDLRTPLALIYSYAEMMHDFPDEITPEQTEMIMNEATRLTSLVNDILDVSRLETGTIELHKKTYNLTESIEDTIKRTLGLVKKDGYVLTFDYESQVYINADDVVITQAFYNLLTNAINYSNLNKNIIVRQIIIDDLVKIEVEDNGDGISEEDLPYIWVTKLLQ